MALGTLEGWQQVLDADAARGAVRVKTVTLTANACAFDWVLIAREATTSSPPSATSTPGGTTFAAIEAARDGEACASEHARRRRRAEIGRLGDRVLDAIDRLGQFALLAGLTARAAVQPRFPWRELLRQLEMIGARSSTIVLITALFTGMVLALQTGIALARFGAKPYVGAVVGLSLARELGPVLTALMVGGRVGAGITAEIGAMQVTEQVDAIRSMGADPVQKLVLPRVLAATLALPLLTVLADVLGMLGGLVLVVDPVRDRPELLPADDQQHACAWRTCSRASPRRSCSAG